MAKQPDVNTMCGIYCASAPVRALLSLCRTRRHDIPKPHSVIRVYYKRLFGRDYFVYGEVVQDEKPYLDGMADIVRKGEHELYRCLKMLKEGMGK